MAVVILAIAFACWIVLGCLTAVACGKLLSGSAREASELDNRPRARDGHDEPGRAA